MTPLDISAAFAVFLPPWLSINAAGLLIAAPNVANEFAARLHSTAHSSFGCDDRRAAQPVKDASHARAASGGANASLTGPKRPRRKKQP
jgi:hypothetical protein